MKKLNYLLLGLAGLAMASCSNEDLQGPGANGDGNVSVRIHLPGDALGTRAGTDYGNGTSNKVLNYAVYDATSGNLLFEGVEPFGTSTETVLNLNLLNKSYKLAFFAQSVASQNTAEADATSNAVYEFNATEKTITVNYENMTSEGNFNDAYDCFYNVVTVEGAAGGSIDVDLYRPMAQINWGTDDIASTKEIETIFGPDGEYIMSNLTVSSQGGLPTTLNFMTGALDGNYKEAIGEFRIPQGAYPIEGYDYVAVQYVLAGAPAAIVSADNGMTASSQKLYDLTLTISNAGNTEGEFYEADAVAVQSVPVQANYQTNIYGTLLSYNFSANIEVIPGFADTYNLEQNTVTVDASELASFRIQEDGVYKLTGNITGRYEIPIGDGLNVIVDASGITNTTEDLSEAPFHLLFIGTMPDNATAVINPAPQQGSYTFKGFTTGALSVKTSNTTVNVVDNNLNFLSMGATNSIINISGNTINGLQGEYERWDHDNSECGVYLHIIRYDLSFDNNNIFNTKGNPFQENGWTANGGEEWYAPDLQNINKVSSFSGNTIGIYEEKEDRNRWTCAITFQGDGTYYWANEIKGDGAEFSAGANEFMEMVKNGNNKFYVAENVDGGYMYKFFTLNGKSDYRFDPFTNKISDPAE